MTTEERKKQFANLNQKQTLRNAIDAGDPSLVKGIYEDQEMRWPCNKCPYLEKCIDLRKKKGAIAEAAA